MSGRIVQFKEVPYFAMSEDCVYSFIKPLRLHTLPSRRDDGFLAVCRYYSRYFAGDGKTREEAYYDWKAKFHYFFQLFLKYGPSTMKDEELFRLMQDNLKKDVYERNSTTNRIVLGTIVDCRLDNECPRSFWLESADELCEVPPYEHVDVSFMLLLKGDRFRGVFEYRNIDNKLLRILHAMPIPKKPDPTKNWE